MIKPKRKGYKPRKDNPLTSYISIPVRETDQKKYKSLKFNQRKEIIGNVRGVLLGLLK